VLIRLDAITDKVIGDEVMALFIRGICGAQYHRRAVEAAAGLLEAVGYGGSEGPWLAIGGAVNSGMPHVGNVGAKGIVDFTALSDTVNARRRAAPLQRRFRHLTPAGVSRMINAVRKVGGRTALRDNLLIRGSGSAQLSC
jgi:adenylate cyclase